MESNYVVLKRFFLNEIKGKSNNGNLMYVD